MCHVSCVMCHVLFVLCHVSCVLCHVSCVICHLSHVMCHISLVIWHKSARMGKILNPCHNFEIFRALVFPEWSLCRGHLITNVGGSSKKLFIPVDPLRMTRYKLSRLRLFRNIELLGSFAARLNIINSCNLIL